MVEQYLQFAIQFIKQYLQLAIQFIEQYLQFAIQFIEEIWLQLNTMFGLEETQAFKFLKPYLLQVQDNPTYMGIAITLMALLLYSLYKIISIPRKRRKKINERENKFNELDVFKECTDMEDQFKLLGKNILQFSQQGDITKARDEYEKLISYQTQKVTEVILALSTTMEGQTTSHVVADKLEGFENLSVTRLAQGVPIGGEVHFLDENTLNTAFQSRKKIF